MTSGRNSGEHIPGFCLDAGDKRSFEQKCFQSRQHMMSEAFKEINT